MSHRHLELDAPDSLRASFDPPRASASRAERASLSRSTVNPRENATIDPETVRVVDDAAVKQNAFPSRPGHPSGMARMDLHLHVEAWVRNVTYTKYLWTDVHVLDDSGAVIHAETVPMHYTRPAGDGGDLFVFDGIIYHGTVASPGSVALKPDARRVDYRLYAEMNGQTFTDGIAHECHLRVDAAST